MIKQYGEKFFGYFEGLKYPISRDSERAEKFEDYKHYKNSIPKEKIISHIESLSPALATMRSTDIFTGEDVTAGQYIDGDYMFPTDFLHYLKNYEIGVPYEYEEYLKKILTNYDEKGNRK